MIKRPEFSAVILDLDGLVLDTEKTYRIAWCSALETMGYSFSQNFYQRLIGLQYESIERIFFWNSVELILMWHCSVRSALNSGMTM